MPELGVPLPLTERIAVLVRGQAAGLALDEVQEALAEVDPREVRAALNTLRKGRFLDVVLEGTQLIYRSPENRPQRVEGSSLESKIIRRAERAKAATASALKAPVTNKPAAVEAVPLPNQNQEAAMPKGVYERKPKKESKPKSHPARRASKRPRGERSPAPVAAPIAAAAPVGSLEIFADGTVHLRGKADQLGRLFEVISQLRAS